MKAPYIAHAEQFTPDNADSSLFWGEPLWEISKSSDVIQTEPELYTAYLAYREEIWQISPPMSREPEASLTVNSQSRESWFEKAWARWMALPKWFVSHQRGPNTLSKDMHDAFWNRRQLESVQIWEHPGQEMIYIGRETPGAKEGGQLLARFPAPQWELRKGESVDEFYERELSTRRIVWTIRSPYAPEPEKSPAPTFRTLMMLEPDELQIRWNGGDASEMEAEVEFGTALSGGPFTLWYLEGSLMDPGDQWSFSATITFVQNGAAKVAVTAYASEYLLRSFASLDVLVEAFPPDLRIYNPTSTQQTIMEGHVHVKVQTDSSAPVMVNGVSTTRDGNICFAWVPLSTGVNIITASSTDGSLGTGEDSVTFTWDGPPGTSGGPNDRDGDGVPDAEDPEPDNPAIRSRLIVTAPTNGLIITVE